jgi:F-type H+-transporting ATPase subunit b
MKVFVSIILAYLANEINLIAAEAGMPQLDPKYWASQAFWLTVIFTSLYLSISKLFIPKIKNCLDDRDNKIKNDLDEAKELKK